MEKNGQPRREEAQGGLDDAKPGMLYSWYTARPVDRCGKTYI